MKRSRRRRRDAARRRLDDAARRTGLAPLVVEQLPYGIFAELYLKGVAEVALFSARDLELVLVLGRRRVPKNKRRCLTPGCGTPPWASPLEASRALPRW